jgi:hypothetical protein
MSALNAEMAKEFDMEREMVATVGATKKMRRGTRRRWRRWLAGSVLGLVVVGAGLFGIGATTGDHTMASVAYAQVPPNEGAHSPVWQRCGFYAEPIGDEHAVHSLEHGVVWIAYGPGVAPDDIERLREMARADDELLVSPYPAGLASPIVVSAWGWQMPVDPVEFSRVGDAVQEARIVAAPPEAGGGCDGPNFWLTGGIGNPEP